MNAYKIQVKLISDALIGSGEGFGAIIDTDIVFDDLGIPYIPGRRIKGCLRDSAEEVCSLLKNSGIDSFSDLNQKDGKFKIIEETFGIPENPSSVNISNLTIEEYEENKNWLGYLSEKYPDILSKDSILSTFTNIRQQTKINDKGVAEERSLRTIRVIKKEKVFTGDIGLSDGYALKLLWLACLNLRHLGTKRNRGFGEVDCRLIEKSQEISFMDELEALCKA